MDPLKFEAGDANTKIGATSPAASGTDTLFGYSKKLEDDISVVDANVDTIEGVTGSTNTQVDRYIDNFVPTFFEEFDTTNTWGTSSTNGSVVGGNRGVHLWLDASGSKASLYTQRGLIVPTEADSDIYLVLDVVFSHNTFQDLYAHDEVIFGIVKASPESRNGQSEDIIGFRMIDSTTWQAVCDDEGTETVQTLTGVNTTELHPNHFRLVLSNSGGNPTAQFYVNDVSSPQQTITSNIYPAGQGYPLIHVASDNTGVGDPYLYVSAFEPRIMLRE